MFNFKQVEMLWKCLVYAPMHVYKEYIYKVIIPFDFKCHGKWAKYFCTDDIFY